MKLKKEIKIDETNIDLETVVNNCVYSSEEKIIGKWFGKPLYSKTILKQINSSCSGEWSFYDHTPNIKNAWFDKSHTFLIRTDNNLTYTYQGIGQDGNNDYWFDSRAIYPNPQTNNNDLKFFIGAVYASRNPILYITMEYTKTTD